MAFWVQAGIFAATSLYAWVRNKQRNPTAAAEPITFGNQPIATDGAPVNVVFGKVLVNNANVVAQVDDRSEPISESAAQEIGHGRRYYSGVMYGVCAGPIDSTAKIYVGGIGIAAVKSTFATFERFTINQPFRFSSGPFLAGSENGVVGTIDVYFGGTGQVADTYLQAKTGVNLPAYRNLCYAVTKDLNAAGAMYFGNDSVFPAVGFEVTRYPNTLGAPSAQAIIGSDANPACMIYEILADAIWGCKISSSLIDSTAFLAAASTLKTEGLGLSMILDGTQSAWDVVLDICRHIDAVVYPSATTGKITIKLVRADYDPLTVPVLDASMLSEVVVRRNGVSTTSNIVIVNYTDRTASYAQRAAQLQDLANIEARGGERVTEEFDFPLVTDATVAQKLAARELRVVAYDLAGVSFKADRNAWAFTPGMVFRLAYAPMGLSMVCRVGDVSVGELGDGKITITAMEDIFGVNWTATSPPAASGWVDPWAPPEPILDDECDVMESPILFGAIESATEMEVLFFAHGRPGPRTDSAHVLVFPSTGELALGSEQPIQLSPHGLLQQQYYSDDTSTLTITNCSSEVIGMIGTFNGLQFKLGAGLILIVRRTEPVPSPSDYFSTRESEIVAYEALNYLPASNTAILSGCVRGVIDTVPRQWFVDPTTGGISSLYGPSKVWFFKAPTWPARSNISPVGLSPIYDPGSATIAATYWVRPIGPGGTSVGGLDWVAPEVVARYCTPRASRPWLPTAFTINGEAWPDHRKTWTTGTAITVGWAHRNRWETAYYDDAHRSPSQTIEPGTVYRVRWYSLDDGLLKRTQDNLISTGTVYLAANQASDNGGTAPSGYRVVVDSHKSGDTSEPALSWATYEKYLIRV